MSSCSSLEEEEEDDDVRFLLPQGVGDTEDVEKYKPGGFHPVHLGDRFDGGRYRIAHKLGAGGFSTVWLARDEKRDKWMALKVVDAEHSASTAVKSAISHSLLAECGTACVAGPQEQFTLDGPNGRHLCLVLPVLGPSLSELSYCFSCRLTPSFARRAAYQATKAVADLHSQGLCHGDVTTGNLLLGISDINYYDEDGIYRLFGRPVIGALETESGEIPGPEAPRYIVKSMDFLSASSSIVTSDVTIVDFDQSFPISSPPKELLGTPIDFLAPEVAVSLAASPASDVWALGCCIFRLRSGDGPFSNPFEVTSPADLISYITHTLGKDMPHEWQDNTLWDSRGRPTKDARKGKPLNPWSGCERSLHHIIYNIWDEPKGCTIRTGIQRSGRKLWLEHEHKPFHSSWSDMVWNPKAIKVDDVYLSGYNDEWDTLQRVLPKIPDHEATLLHDLLSKTFVYEPTRRPTAQEMLDHPWFHLKN
ncbi:hypothetical protein QQS21_012377 [Conoideocrella luteorostrata]|uniref:EKC/KEOPS complex subunit BUD32 n=1 Tax=Conoideocrella luteorostrata TaxID=1105319 RepID=A0AAJ0CBA4_9HYPO|nr:hypothetical protein QQS21_012377 [Conoideocrella luteorostrata]